MAFRNEGLSFEARAEDLLARLTLKEKIGQMVYDAPAIERLGIPAYNWWNECLHGVGRAGLATVFPQAIGLAATFDADLMGRAAEAISDEARAKHHENARRGDHGIYHGLTFWSPNINIFRDPRWGRGHETYGECPYLTARLGVAFCQGLQGDDATYLKLVATPKHYAVHSGPEGKRHSFDAAVSEKDLRETYLPAFRACVEAGAHSVMTAYNRTNGEVCSGSSTLIGAILREEWGFEGYVVSDCGAINDFHAHHKVTKTPEESAALAVRMGCDLNCGRVYDALGKAVRKGLLTEGDIDRSLRRLLLARFRLGMFDAPDKVPHAGIPYEVVDCEEHRALALETAQKSLVLLKNDGLLPLDPDAVRSIAVIGPNADHRDMLLGNYNGTPSRLATPLEAIRQRLGEGVRVWYAPGCEHTAAEHPAIGKATRGFAEAAAVAERADAVVLCMGLTPSLEGEEGDASNADAAGDRLDIGLPGVQNQLISAVLAAGKPTVLAVISGSALAIPWAQQHVPAIVQQFYPGQAGGEALAGALFGDYSPSGRLPVTVYRSLADVPPFEDYAMAGRTYRFFEGEPLYPFGFGLSYARFSYSDLKVLPERILSGQQVAVTARVTNTGGRRGREVCQLYLSHEDPPVRAPVRQLAGVQVVDLGPGESTSLGFTLTKDQVRLYDDAGQLRHYPGRIRVSVGGSQPDPRSQALGAPEPIEAVAELG
jgi:beta-glucosidase